MRTRYVVRSWRLARQHYPCDLAVRPQSRERTRATALKLLCFYQRSSRDAVLMRSQPVHRADPLQNPRKGGRHGRTTGDCLIGSSDRATAKPAQKYGSAVNGRTHWRPGRTGRHAGTQPVSQSERFVAGTARLARMHQGKLSDVRAGKLALNEAGTLRQRPSGHTNTPPGAQNGCSANRQACKQANCRTG